MNADRLIASAVLAANLSALTFTYLAAVASPAPSPRPEPVIVRPATPAEDAAWQRRQLEYAIDEARRADQ